MKKVHYQHIGFPRTGTTWLWNSLINNKKIFEKSSLIEKLKARTQFTEFWEGKENTWQERNIAELLKNPQPYIDLYKEYDISLNFRALNYKFDEVVIEKISEYTTHVGITIRNPYEMFRSMFIMQRKNFDNLDMTPPDGEYIPILLEWEKYKKNMNPDATGNNYNDWIDFFIDHQYDIVGTLNRWGKFKNKFKIFVYDDLVNDSTKFYTDVCKFIDIEPNKELKQFVFVTDPGDKHYLNDFIFSRSQILKINKQIDQISSILDRNLSHWKQPEV